MRRHICFFAVTLALFVAFATPAGAQKEYTLRIDVRAADGGSVAGTNVTIWGQVEGSQIFDVRAPSVLDRGQYGAIFTLDQMGFGLVFLAPGTYKVSVKNKFYKPKEIYISIPGQGQEGQMNHGAVVTLEKDTAVISRTLTVTVLGEKFEGGRSVTVPLSNARVQVSSQESEDGAVQRSGSNGVYTFNEPFVIGTEVQISVSADGWEPRDAKLIVGSWQQIDPNDRRTTTSDQITVKLRQKLKVEEFSLIVEVVDSKTGKPVPGASVDFEMIELGAAWKTVTTNLQGRTQPVEIPAVKATQKHAEFRVKVKANGYKEKWSDIPYDLPLFGEARSSYVVHLEPNPKANDTQNQGQGQNPYNLPPQFKNRTVIRVEPLDPVLECWAAGADKPCDQPNLEVQIIVYHFAGGGNYWDRRDYDAKRKQMADAGMVFRWACGKSLWRNGRCG
ncbi:MAG: hypothetical protein ABL952_03385 [Pyrinomonadaceae bacterium]